MLYAISFIVVIIIGILAFTFHKAKLGIDKPLDNLKPSIDALLKRGFNGGILIFTDRKSKNFVQFSKYIKNNNEYGIELGFPKAKWSSEYFPKLHEYCESNSIKCTIDRSSDLEFLNIDFEKDTESATQLTIDIFTKIFNMNPQCQVATIMHNASLEKRKAD